MLGLVKRVSSISTEFDNRCFGKLSLRQLSPGTETVLSCWSGKRLGMAQDILIEARGKNIVVAMPGTSYRIRYRRPNSGHQLVAYQLPSADDPAAGMTSADLMKLAWRIATEKARELGWIA